MSASRLNMLIDIGVDLFTGECLPGTTSLNQVKQFDLLTSSPAEKFPADNNKAEMGAPQCREFSSHDDEYWTNDDFLADFEKFKAKNGHSLVLASDDKDLYLWFVEKRGKALLSEIGSTEFSSGFKSNANGLYSHSILQYITTHSESDDDSIVNGPEKTVEVDQPMFLWLHYCERLMMFKGKI